MHISHSVCYSGKELALEGLLCSEVGSGEDGLGSGPHTCKATMELWVGNGERKWGHLSNWDTFLGPNSIEAGTYQPLKWGHLSNRDTSSGPNSIDACTYHPLKWGHLSNRYTNLPSIRLVGVSPTVVQMHEWYLLFPFLHIIMTKWYYRERQKEN